MTRIYLWQKGLLADRPAPGVESRVYFAIDINEWFIDDGTAWQSGGVGATGPPGPASYTTTSANFTQPASAATVSATVGSTAWMATAQYLYIAGGGYYSVSSITDATHVVITNLGYTGNAAPGATVTSGVKVTPAGVQGATGATGGVASFNARTGAVVPASGDYSYSQITGTPAIASQAQADAGTDDATIMTPLKVASRPQKNSVFETHMQGLQLTWNTPGNNGNLLTVSNGSAWIPSLGRVYNVPSTITGPTQTLTASSWHYVYLYDNAGTPAIEISTVAPAAPYKGTARNKTSDTSRRLIGAVITGAGATPAMTQFISMGEAMIYTPGPPRVVGPVGPGLTNQNPSIASAAPPGITAEVLVQVQASTGATAGLAYIEWTLQSGGGRVGLVGAYIAAASQFAFTTAWLPVLPATPSFFYNTIGPTGSAFYVDLAGYRITR